MRRQVGAYTVDFDTEEGYAKYALKDPAKIDFEAIQEASLDAAYTVKTIQLELTGELSTKSCATCSRDVPRLVVERTGQVFELTESASEAVRTKPGRVRVRADALGWDGEHIRLEVSEFLEPY